MRFTIGGNTFHATFAVKQYLKYKSDGSQLKKKIMQSAPLNVIFTCFYLPDSHMYTENIQTPPMKPQLCEQDKYPETSLEPSWCCRLYLDLFLKYLIWIIYKKVHASYSLTAIFLSMLIASVHHSYRNEGKNQCQWS